jgi:hypothetical protein
MQYLLPLGYLVASAPARTATTVVEHDQSDDDSYRNDCKNEP